jgi:hypothetical protein
MAEEDPVESLRAGRFSKSTGEDVNRWEMVVDEAGKFPTVDFPDHELRSTSTTPSR